jgi:hypothetical protein
LKTAIRDTELVNVPIVGKMEQQKLVTKIQNRNQNEACTTAANGTQPKCENGSEEQ